MTKDDFRKMCQSHDLTYSYSDDGEVWRRGEESLRKLKKASESLPTHVAKDIWDSVVDSKIAEGYRSPFYWR